jgi:methylenetetrahydrofolate dehydrogenase (NADP+)/methenyltetrahydrofolate cyclohydrolase
MLILDGKKARDARTKSLMKGISALSRAPKLAIIQVGGNPDSALYIEQKKRFGTKIGAVVDHIRFGEGVSADEITKEIDRLNRDASVDGIIVQLPLPPGLDRDSLIARIDPAKDVDGLTPENAKLLADGLPRFVPATAKGVMSLLDFYGESLEGKDVAVLGRSKLVGTPVAEIARARGGRVTVCHSQTPNTKEVTNASNVIIVAIGKPEFIDVSYIKAGAIVIDVGINVVEAQSSKFKVQKLEEEIPRRKIVGDVDFAGVSKVASAISPVPGGVGPMTVLSLFENLLDAAKTA